MEQSKKRCFWIFLTCLLGGMLFAMPIKAQAASYKVCGYGKTKVGSYYIWGDNDSNAIRISKSKSGNGSVLASASDGRHMEYRCLSNGSEVYYVESYYIENRESTIGYVYRIKVNGRGKSYIGRVNNVDAPAAYSNGYLYLNCDEAGSMPGNVYRLNVKTGKSRCVVKNTVVIRQYKHYLLTRPNSGDAGAAADICVYNCKTGKKVCLTKKGASGYFSNGKIYYVEQIRYTGSENIYRVRSCSLAGKGKKTLAKITCGYIFKVTEQYIYYLITDHNTWSTRYCRYNIKTKKTREISESQYHKIVGY